MPAQDPRITAQVELLQDIKNQNRRLHYMLIYKAGQETTTKQAQLVSNLYRTLEIEIVKRGWKQ